MRVPTETPKGKPLSAEAKARLKRLREKEARAFNPASHQRGAMDHQADGQEPPHQAR